jgi:dihydrodipicolinate reductase
MIKIVVAGSTGRMGRTLLEAVLGAQDLSLHAALEQRAMRQSGATWGSWSDRRRAWTSPSSPKRRWRARTC